LFTFASSTGITATSAYSFEEEEGVAQTGSLQKDLN